MAELVACVSGVLVYDVSRLEDPFRSGICFEFAGSVLQRHPLFHFAGSMLQYPYAHPATRHVEQSCVRALKQAFPYK